MQSVLSVTIATMVNYKKMANRSIVQYLSYHKVHFHLDTSHIVWDFMGGQKWPVKSSFPYTTRFIGVKFQSDTRNWNIYCLSW